MKNKLLPTRIGSAVYILPNLLTTGNLFFGYFSIVKSMQYSFTWAAASILLATIFDVLDGRIARLTKGTSEFGVQYDSLCDLVSFGVAPAFLMYQYSLMHSNRIGWIVCFIFLACGALRLARFNVQTSLGKASGDFVGLPIPIAAAVIACFVAFIEDLRDEDAFGIATIDSVVSFIQRADVIFYFLLVLSLILAALMVSNVAYRSHKSISMTSIRPFRILVILVVLVGFVAYKPSLLGFIVFFVYVLSGVFEYILGWKKPQHDDDFFSTPDEEQTKDRHE